MEIWKKQKSLSIESVFVNDQTVCFFISDGRTISMSLSLYAEFNDAEQGPIRNCQIVEDSQAVYWPEFNKTIRLEEVLRD